MEYTLKYIVRRKTFYQRDSEANLRVLSKWLTEMEITNSLWLVTTTGIKCVYWFKRKSKVT
jgi:hypothetical protein